MAKDEHPADSHVFDKPATLREPAAPSVPAEARPETLQRAREATDALLQEILEEDFLNEAPEPRRAEPPAPPAREEDWPAELHSLHLPEQP
ncbi:MAG TPA: hypothetical protein VFZ09_13615 [Archangium sp.]|uniref:hypothetical protein n=1 Tax=Archangium sp. TaxID=1872627 RepID=UPI002E32818D|nr:hypothetical protein [Archangium sp.]HEX5747275.1 hypothetical protein [Archangium sp.]